MAKKGNSIDPAHFLGKYKAFSAARCVWCGKKGNSIDLAHFLGKYKLFSAARRSLALRGVLSFGRLVKIEQLN